MNYTTSYKALPAFLPAFCYKNLQFFGGRKADVGLEERFDLLINLTGAKYVLPLPTFDSVSQSKFPFANFFEQIDNLKDVPQLVIKWQDFDIPDLPPQVWQALIGDLQSFSRLHEQKRLRIGIFCEGGTGRTGTALAILRNLLLEEICDPVAVIRSTYKKTAVETYSQIEYVEYVTGAESDCAPSKTYNTATTYSSTSTSPALTTSGGTCTHTLAITGCKGGCVEYYAKKNATSSESEKAQSIVDKHYGTTPVVNTPDCPACKLPGTGLGHTNECNKAYFAKAGICPECYEDISKNEYDHKSECSKHPFNFNDEGETIIPGEIVEEVEEEDNISATIAEAIANGDYDDNSERNDWSSLIERTTGKNYDEIKQCEGCLAGKFEAEHHSKECNDAYFKDGDAPF